MTGTGPAKKQDDSGRAEVPSASPPAPDMLRPRRRAGYAALEVAAAAAASCHREATISGLQATWDYTEAFVGEDEVLTAAAQRGTELGAVPIKPGGGAALRFLAAALDARAVVEIGTGCGVSGVWLLRGMHPDGVLTTIDLEGEHQRLAKQAYADAGISTTRTRLISGAALDVLPRLTDGAYDLVFCDGEKTEYGDYLREALRLLRVGGVVAFDNATWHHRVADPSQRDAATITVRELGKQVREDARLVPVLLPVGDGLLAAVKREA
jgi:predicted O-methyltransferase YrrM